MRVRRYRLRRDSGGTGAAPGGDGIERELQVLEDCTVSLITERRVSRPWGLDGGEPGAVGENWLLPGGDVSRAERLPDKCTVQLEAGDVVRMLTPGGGGFGTPEAWSALKARLLRIRFESLERAQEVHPRSPTSRPLSMTAVVPTEEPLGPSQRDPSWCRRGAGKG
jgi:N-methylhydantoinase B/oxoprolinase/acetone carboxylase alpha subunit